MEDEILPATADAVVDLLDQRFPERSPNPGETMDMLMFQAGARSVVRFLLALRSRRDTNILTNQKIT